MKNNMVIYVSKDGNVKVDVNIQNEDIYMSQDVMANLYDTTKQNISYHLNNIFKEKELSKDSVVKDFLTTANDGKKYNVLHYNLDAIIAVEYRINSKKAPEFEEYLSLRDMRSISKNADMPQYIKFIYDNDPLYEVIREWDEAFSLDGNLCDNPSKTKQMILQKARMKGRK